MSPLYLFISVTKSSITLSVTSEKVITSLAVKVKKKKLSEFRVVKGDGVTALETGALFIYRRAQIVQMQTTLSSLISTSHLFSLGTEGFLLILLLGLWDGRPCRGPAGWASQKQPLGAPLVEPSLWFPAFLLTGPASSPDTPSSPPFFQSQHSRPFLFCSLPS